MKMQPEYARLETATDAVRMRGRIEEQLRRRSGDPVNIEGFWVTRVFPRRNGRFVVQYEINVKDFVGGDGGKVYLCGILLGPEEESPWYVKPDNKNVIVFEDIRMILPVFPYDPKIKNLFTIVDSLRGKNPEELRPALEHVGAGNRIVTGYEILGYRLERRCVIRCSLSERTAGGTAIAPRLIVKIFRPGRALDPVRRLQWLRNNGFRRGESVQLAVPEVLYYENKKGLAIMENAPGASPHDLLGDSSFENACRAAALMLRKLHGLKAGEGQPYSMIDELETLEGKIELCGNIFPAIRERLLAAYGRLGTEGKGIDENFSATVHGDFHDKQILYSTETSTLLDCDDMKYSDPALDYGNFLAHLSLRRIQFPERAGDIKKGMKAFANAYSSTDGEFENRVGWWTAAALIRLVVIYSLRPRWRSTAPKIIQVAEHVLGTKNVKHGGVDAIYPK